MNNVYKNFSRSFKITILSLLIPFYIYAQGSSVNFIYISDWGGKAGSTQKAVAEQMGITAKKLHTKFIITGGDNYHGDGIDSENSPRWISEFEDVYTDKSLFIPWYPSLGNHDNNGSPNAEIQYSTKSKRWVFPSRYYAHTYRLDNGVEILFVHLDTSPFVDSYRKNPEKYHFSSEDPKIQIRWLDSVLSHSTAKWKFVIGHHPVYSASSKHGDTQEIIENILPVLVKNRVNVYLCGHDHIMQHLFHAPIDYFICGTGAGHRDVEKRDDVVFEAASAGFLNCTVSDKNIIVTYISDNGETLYTTTIR